MSCGKARGFTLIEALTACALIAMLGVLILQVVVPMARGTVRGTQQIELQQIAALAMDRFCIDLQSTAPAGAKPMVRRVPPSATSRSGCGDSMTLWVNGREVLTRMAYRNPDRDEDTVTVPLHAGSNDILVRVSRGIGANGLYFRVE